VRAIGRFLNERDPEPTATIFDDERRFQSKPWSGEHACGDDGLWSGLFDGSHVSAHYRVIMSE
jgi:hypothetical protein